MPKYGNFVMILVSVKNVYKVKAILISSYNSPIHLRPIRRRVVMLYLELFAELRDHRLLRFVPLSVMILSGTPYRQIRLCRINRATTFLVTVTKEAASTHFVK